MARDEPITYKEPPAEHKQRYDEIKAQFEADLISSFERTCHHGVRWKGFSPEGALDGVDLSTPSEQPIGLSGHRPIQPRFNRIEVGLPRTKASLQSHHSSPTFNLQR
jgi:hypothetical protein